MMEQRKSGKGSPMGVEDWKRTMRALGRQVEDAESVGQALEIFAELEQVIRANINRLHDEGYSWTELARGTGVSRQAMRQRWADDAAARSTRTPPPPIGPGCTCDGSGDPCSRHGVVL